MYRILSIEGGGVRGLIPAIILNKLEQEIQKIANNPTLTIGDVFDTIAGTSCGAILTCLYTLPDPNIKDKQKPKHSASDVLKIFRANVSTIFLKTWTGLVWAGPEYSSDGINKVATEVAGELKINELTKPVFIPTYDMSTGSPMYFTKYEHKDYKVRDIIKAATAAPTYFTPVSLTSEDNKNTHTCIDGGVFMNNPSYAALLDTLAQLEKLPPSQRPERIVLVSISCGANSDKLPPGAEKWGKIHWICPIINISIDMNSDIVDKQLLQIFNLCGDVNDYFRFDPPLKEGTNSIDNITVKNLEGLEKDALNYINSPEVQKKIEKLAKILVNI
jgi:patatin-like phospholipase/acyl hydrolase